MSYEEDLKRCQKIFSRSQIRFKALIPIGNEIPNCMEELYYLLKFYNVDAPCMQENIHWVAILGAVGRLFEALGKHNSFKNLLTWEFKNSVRRVIYHSRGPFCATNLGEAIPPGITVAFFIHCYEHCRTELTLATQTGFPSLADNIDLSDRNLPLFHKVMNIGSIWADEKIQSSEVKSKALSRLESNEVRFLVTILYIRENIGCFIKSPSPEEQKKTNVIVGNFIGAEVAWLSCDVSSLLQGRAIDEHLPGRTKLSTQERDKIRGYEKYVELGIKYRHENLSVNVLLAKFGLSTASITPRGDLPVAAAASASVDLMTTTFVTASTKTPEAKHEMPALAPPTDYNLSTEAVAVDKKEAGKEKPHEGGKTSSSCSLGPATLTPAPSASDHKKKPKLSIIHPTTATALASLGVFDKQSTHPGETAAPHNVIVPKLL